MSDTIILAIIIVMVLAVIRLNKGAGWG